MTSNFFSFLQYVFIQYFLQKFLDAGSFFLLFSVYTCKCCYSLLQPHSQLIEAKDLHLLIFFSSSCALSYAGFGPQQSRTPQQSQLLPAKPAEEEKEGGFADEGEGLGKGHCGDEAQPGSPRWEPDLRLCVSVGCSPVDYRVPIVGTLTTESVAVRLGALLFSALTGLVQVFLK